MTRNCEIFSFFSKGVRYHLRQSSVDSCLWDIKPSGKSKSSAGLLSTYVDDLLATGPVDLLRDLFKAIASIWELTEPDFVEPCTDGSLTFLGTQIEFFKSGKAVLHQSKYISDLLRKYDMLDCKPSRSLGPDFKVVDDTLKQVPQELLLTKCQSAIGGLIWVSSRARPDISYATNKAASEMSKSPAKCWLMIKKIFRYLAGTIKHGLEMLPFDGDEIPPLCSFADASFTGQADTYSQEGICIMWGDCPILWKSSKQTLIASSTAMSELMALAKCLSYSLGLRDTLFSISVEPKELRLYCDNKSALKSAMEGSTWASRHYTLKAQFLREYSRRGLVHLQYVSTKSQVADCLTKPVGKEVIKRTQGKLFGNCNKEYQLRESVGNSNFTPYSKELGLIENSKKSRGKLDENSSDRED